jgi:hypothetical protein
MVIEPNLISTAMESSPSSSSSTTTISTSFSIPVAEKLSKTNYMLWHTQVMPAIHAAHLDDIPLGIEKMPVKTISDKVGDTTTEKIRPFLGTCCPLYRTRCSRGDHVHFLY